MKRSIKNLFLALPVLAAGFTAPAFADAYEVTITNITSHSLFTPFLVATHKPGFPVFALGEAASTELAQVAEGGDTSHFETRWKAEKFAYDTKTTEGLLGPGESTSVVVRTKGRFQFISAVAMILPTNDGFVALNGVLPPKSRRATKVVMSPGYDAGSENNDELCAHIPGGGPCGGGEGYSEENGEGFVHIHSGIHGIADVGTSYDWNNPTARFLIRKVH